MARPAVLSGPPLFANCTSAYLDIGANRGLHVQRVANGASFARFFPVRAARRDVCVVGIEPNPSHTASLRRIEAEERAAGRRVTILPVAVSDTNGEAVFWSDQDYQAGEWGSSLLRWQRKMTPRKSSRVATVSLDWLLQTHVLAAAPAHVVVKMDIEGAEYDALPPALEAVCRGVDTLALEMHARFFKEKWRGHRPGFSTNLTKVEHLIKLLEGVRERKRRGTCRTQVVSLGSVEPENAKTTGRGKGG